MIVASASRRERCQAARGNGETSGTLGRKSKRARRRGPDRLRLRLRDRRGLGDARARALPQAQVALGGELRVGVHGDAPRDAELARQVARRRHPLAGPQRPVADRAPELVLDLRAERPGTVAAHREQQLYRLTGLVQCHGSRACFCTSGTYHRPNGSDPARLRPRPRALPDGALRAPPPCARRRRARARGAPHRRRAAVAGAGRRLRRGRARPPPAGRRVDRRGQLAGDARAARPSRRFAPTPRSSPSRTPRSARSRCSTSSTTCASRPRARRGAPRAAARRRARRRRAQPPRLTRAGSRAAERRADVRRRARAGGGRRAVRRRRGGALGRPAAAAAAEPRGGARLPRRQGRRARGCRGRRSDDRGAARL